MRKIAKKRFNLDVNWSMDFFFPEKNSGISELKKSISSIQFIVKKYRF